MKRNNRMCKAMTISDRMCKVVTLLLLFTFHFSLFTSQAQSLDSLRTEARHLADRGYYGRSLETISRIPDDSLTLSDMRLHYDALCSLGREDSLEFWGDKILRYDPYCIPVILDYTNRLNRGIRTEIGTAARPMRVIEIIEQYQKRDSTHILVNRQLAEAYYNIGNFDRALPELRRLEALGDSCFGTLYTTGLTLQRMGDDSGAYDYLYRAYQKNDHHPYCLFVLGIVCNRIGLAGEALSYLDAAKDLMMPDSKTLYRLHKELAEAFRGKNEVDFRLQELEECVKYADEGDLPVLHYQMGMCHINLRHVEQAKQLLGQFLEETKDREYNNNIKSMRRSADEQLKMILF